MNENKNNTQEQFFKVFHEVMIVPDIDTKGNFLNKYLLIDRKHYLECKDKDPMDCNMFNMDRVTLRKGENEFNLHPHSPALGDRVKIKISNKNLVLEYKEVEMKNWMIQRSIIYKESLKLNRYYKSDYYGVHLTPFWYEKLSRLEIIK